MEPVLTVRSEADYDRAVARLNELLDEVGDDATPLYGLLDTLGTLVHAYEVEQVEMPAATGVEALQYLMEEHGLTQSDLPEIGSQVWCRRFCTASAGSTSARFARWANASGCRRRVHLDTRWTVYQHVMTASRSTSAPTAAALTSPYIHRYLSEECYLSIRAQPEIVEKSIANSLCFGVYDGDRQMGFARVVTDCATTFAWLCDVFIDAAYRWQGWANNCRQRIVAHPELQGMRNFILAARDAHEVVPCYGGFALARRNVG